MIWREFSAMGSDNLIGERSNGRRGRLPCPVGTVLVQSSEVGGNGRASVLLKVRDAGMQGEKFLCSLWVFKVNLAPFLLPCEPMRVFTQVIAARCSDDLDVLHVVEHWKFPNGAALYLQSLSVWLTSERS